MRGPRVGALLATAAFLALSATVSQAAAAPAQALPGQQREWKAGTAVANITPAEWIWMGGYAARTRPASGKEMDLRLKALALEDGNGWRAVIVTSDLIGFPRSISEHVCAALKERYGLERDSVILSASHTHCGPVLRESAVDAYGLNDAERAKVGSYSGQLEQTAIATVGRALENLTPVRLAAGSGTTGFAANRRNNREKEVPKLIAEGKLEGPVDHSVPVLAVFSPGGELKAVLFGYACHNTTMDYYKWSGDYAGFAQLALEKHHTNATAMFFMGCGADQNPLPRREVALAERYGGMLAAAVEETLISPMKALEPELKTRMETVELALGKAPTREELERIVTNSTSAPTQRRWATRLLAEAKAGRTLPQSYSYPVQAWRLGGQLLVTLGGEPTVDYSIRFKKEFGPATWVAGYCNDVMGYVPSLRVLKEDDTPTPRPGWGYEGARSMIATGLPAWRWSERIEDQVAGAVRRVAKP